MSRPPTSSWWILITILIFGGVATAAVWSGWSHSNDPAIGPAPITLRDMIRSRGGAPGSTPP